MSDLLGHKMQTQQMTQHILFSRLPSATENKWRSRRIILILFSLLKIMAYLTVCFFFHLQAIFKLLLLLQPFVFLCTRIQSLRNLKHDGCILNIALDRSSHLLHMKHQSCIHLYEYQVLFFYFVLDPSSAATLQNILTITSKVHVLLQLQLAVRTLFMK